MNRQRYWKDSWLVTLTHRPGPCQTPHHSLVDLRTGMPPTAKQQLWAWKVPRDPQSPVFSHTLEWERPVGAGLGAIGFPNAKWICFALFFAKNVIIQELGWCGNQGDISSSYTKTVTLLGPPFFPRFSLVNSRLWHSCASAASLLSYSATAVIPALPGTRNVSFPCLSNTNNYNLNLQYWSLEGSGH